MQDKKERKAKRAKREKSGRGVKMGGQTSISIRFLFLFLFSTLSILFSFFATFFYHHFKHFLLETHLSFMVVVVVVGPGVCVDKNWKKKEVSHAFVH